MVILRHLVELDEELVVLDHAGEKFASDLVVVVGAHPGVDAVVPPVQTAHQVVALDPPVGEQRAAVEAAAVEDRVVVATADEDEVDAVDRRTRRLAVDEVGEGRDANARLASGARR